MMDGSVHQPVTSVLSSALKEQSVVSLGTSIDPTAEWRKNSRRKVQDMSVVKC